MHSRKRFKDFQAYLRSIYAITPTSRNEVYDQHYEIFGFDSIQSTTDIDSFFELLNLDAQKLGLAKCKRTVLLRKALKSTHGAVETYRISEIGLFKVLASQVRHIKCDCHEKGSYYPQQELKLAPPQSATEKVPQKMS